MEDVGIFLEIWPILRSFGIFCGDSVYGVVFYILFPVLVCCTYKNLATLMTVSYSFSERICSCQAT
jgi:hypothetical protein